MTKEMDFFIFLLESYSAHKKIGTDEVFNKLEKLNLTDLIYDMYEIYHQEAIENAFDDIDKLINEYSDKIVK